MPSLMMAVDAKSVKASYNFKGANNDELCFNKGDVITITQNIEGGWWEGTLNGVTGWFPSNYVKEMKPELPMSGVMVPAGVKDLNAMVHVKRESMQFYHNVVLQNIIETEKVHVNELNHVLQNYIRPLKASAVLNPAEFAMLVGNLEEVAVLQHSLLSDLDDCCRMPHHQRKVGGIFMKYAPTLKEVYLEYCANHPRAVAVLQRKSEDLNRVMESFGAPVPGSVTLTMSLSRPFTRLDKYPSLLKESERHIEESHIDRGDTQRAIALYRDITISCNEIRKFKEMEYDILYSTIKEWEGEEISKLGEVMHICKVKSHAPSGEKLERILTLFPTMIVMLSVRPRFSGYHYEGKLPLHGMKVALCEEPDALPNSIEISGESIERVVFVRPTKKDAAHLVEILQQQINRPAGPITNNISPSKPHSLQIHSSQPSISPGVQAKVAKVSQEPTFPPQPKPHKIWSQSCLCPAPPLRPAVTSYNDTHRKNHSFRKKLDKSDSEEEYKHDSVWRRYDPKTFQEDAAILRVIEAYCNSAKSRHTVGSLDLSKLRLGDGSHDLNDSSDPLISPDFDEYALGPAQMRGFCCVNFPVAKGLAKTIKRL